MRSSWRVSLTGNLREQMLLARRLSPVPEEKEQQRRQEHNRPKDRPSAAMDVPCSASSPCGRMFCFTCSLLSISDLERARAQPKP
jgi:hypothetical protein